MLSPRSIKPHIFFCFFLVFVSYQSGFAQINSPYSRYGIGDLYTSRNVANKGMGNMSVAYYDYSSVNFMNPASYSRQQMVTFDVGAEIETRKLKDPQTIETYRSGNVSFSYVALGIPLTKDKKGLTNWGMAIGLRPISKMRYNVEEYGRLQGIDSVLTSYEGTGGVNQVFLGTGFRIKGFALGVNLGYYFGQTKVSSRQQFINDSVVYYMGQFASEVSFKKLKLDAGMQYDIKVGKTTNLRLAASGYLGNKMNASKDIFRQTINYANGGGFDTIDVVYRERNIEGDIDLPGGYTVGVTLDRQGLWMLGVEFEQTKWDDYRHYNQTDQVGNSRMLRVGGQYSPQGRGNTLANKKYLNRVVYRAGLYSGKDYITANGEQLPIIGGSIGFGFPIRKWNAYTNQYTLINTAFEFGKRGKDSQPLTETFFKFNVGLCLSDIWFIKRKFD
jgi:hypothetical protein